MAQDKKKKKVSIAEALETIRGGGTTGKSALARAPQRRAGRPTAAFWLKNLLESVERRQDQLFESVRSDPGARAHMFRRDFHASEQIYVPFDQLEEYLHQPATVHIQKKEKPRGQILSRLQQMDKIDLSGDQVKSGIATVASRLKDPAQEEDDDGLLGRFTGIENVELGQGLVFEEVQQEQQRQNQKKLRVNPMIRKMFEKREQE
ncbi:MAG: hypothetical protein HY319_22195 [Armatimonadetes bacterium]|nr:hypothetical protein [Armatimonadota bacterium]